MVRLLEYAGAPARAKLPASSGVEFGFVLRSSARSRVESGSSVTPGIVNTRSRGERVETGSDSVSRVFSAAPTIVRFVSTAEPPAATTTVSVFKSDGRRVKLRHRLSPGSVGAEAI